MRSRIEMHHGDCLELMPSVAAGSVDAIICDPPYGTVKNAPSTWDAVKTAWDTTISHDTMLDECNRALRPNGALVLFSQDPYTAKLMTETHGNLPFSYRYTWKKDTFANHLGCKKAPVNYTEDVCVFFKRHEDKRGHPLQKYFSEQLSLSGLTTRDVCMELGTTHASHFFTKGLQFRTPNAEYLRRLQELTGLFKIEYSEVRDTQEEFLKEKRERYPPVFNLPPDAKYKSNVLEYRKDYRGEHPTQKPVALMEDLVRTYTNEGDTVLDFTMGSGTTGVACVNTGRHFIGIEKDAGYYDISRARISNAENGDTQGELTL
jgi:DNA modification methylase